MRKTPLIIPLLVVLAVLTSKTAWANDQIISTVTPLTQPYSSPPIIENNGVAQGNIRLLYTVVGTSFPCGSQDPFATFNLGMVDQLGSGQPGVYPATLSLAGSGHGTPVQLSPDPASFTVNGVGWNDNSTVTVNVPNCAGLPTADGSVIDGQMNASTNPGAHLNTITSVQVHILLVYPSASACLKLYSFESEQETFNLMTSVKVIIPTAFVKSTSPNQVSVDGMVVNTCAVPETFDEGINLGQYWATNPGPTAFDATFTYTTAGEFDPSNYNLANWGTGTQQGETVCINNFTLQPGYSFLMRVYSRIISGTPVRVLPTNPKVFPFGAALYAPNTSCSGNLLPGSLVTPANPATSALTWSF